MEKLIDDNTEMMSEFDEHGNKTFQNGFEKLAFYFDMDKDGVIKGDELKSLKVWIDDGDGKTESGELQTLTSQGITEIVIPGAHQMVSTTKQRTEVEKNTSQSFAGTTYADTPIEEEPDPDALYVLPVTQDVTVKSGQSDVTVSSKAEMTVFRSNAEKTTKFTRLHEFALGNMAQQVVNELNAGTVTIDNGVLDVNLSVAERDAQNNLKTMMYAEPELGVYKSLVLMSLIGNSTRTEVVEKNQQVAEVLFSNEDKQTAQINENKPPSVDSVDFSNTYP